MKQVPLRDILSFQSIILALIPFAILIGLGAWWVLPQIRSEIEARQLQLATTIASQIESHLTAPTISIKSIAALYGQEREQATAVQSFLNEQVRASESLQSIYICGPQGRVAAVALSSMNETQRQDLLGLDLSRNSLLLDASRQGRPVWSDTFLSIVGGGLSVAFAVPSDRMVTIGEIDLKLLTDFLKQISSIDEQKIFIVDRRGQVIADRGHCVEYR